MKIEKWIIWIALILTLVYKVPNLIFKIVTYEHAFYMTNPEMSLSSIKAVIDGYIPYRDFPFFYMPLFPISGLHLLLIPSPYTELVLSLAIPFISLFILSKLTHNKKELVLYFLILNGYALNVSYGNYKSLQPVLIGLLSCLTLYFFLKKREKIAGIIIGIAFLMDHVSIITAIALLIFLIYKKRNILGFTLAFLLVSAPILIIYHVITGGYSTYLLFINPFISARRGIKIDLQIFLTCFIAILLVIYKRKSPIAFILFLFMISLVKIKAEYVYGIFYIIPLFMARNKSNKLNSLLLLAFTLSSFSFIKYERTMEFYEFQMEHNYKVFDIMKNYDSIFTDAFVRLSIMMGKKTPQIIPDSMAYLWLSDDGIIPDAIQFLTDRIRKADADLILIRGDFRRGYNLNGTYEDSIFDYIYSLGYKHKELPFYLDNLECKSCYNTVHIFYKSWVGDEIGA